MNNTTKRILAGLGMLVIAAAAIAAEYFGFPGVQILGVTIVVAMIIEFLLCFLKTSQEKRKKNLVLFIVALAWLLLMLVAVYFISKDRPFIILLILMIVSLADIGAWFFGNKIGGDKMWEKLSAGKTWSGQIAGILCGTLGGIMYGLLGADVFMPQLMWIGISVALLSQYGDLTASWIKRKFGLKDFSTLIPGHGGVIDRFDGWIYALPIIWLVML